MDVDFVVIGNPQSGTTSLLNYLPQHPEIYMQPDEDNVFWRANFTESSYYRWRKTYPFRGEVLTRRVKRKLYKQYNLTDAQIERRFGKNVKGSEKGHSTGTWNIEIVEESAKTFPHLRDSAAVVGPKGEVLVSSEDEEMQRFLREEGQQEVGKRAGSSEYYERSNREEGASAMPAENRNALRENEKKTAGKDAAEEPRTVPLDQITEDQPAIRNFKIGVKDPLLVFSPEVMGYMGMRLSKTKIIIMIRDPLEFLISWLQSGCSWQTPWDDKMHFGVGFYVEHINIAKQMLMTGGMLTDGDFLYVPTYQLRKNPDFTLREIMKFIGVKDVGFRFNTKSQHHVSDYRPFPHELKVCELKVCLFRTLFSV